MAAQAQWFPNTALGMTWCIASVLGPEHAGEDEAVPDRGGQVAHHPEEQGQAAYQGMAQHEPEAEQDLAQAAQATLHHQAVQQGKADPAVETAAPGLRTPAVKS